jgi:kynureninase
MDPLLHWRKEFPSLERTIYMISHSLGAMPARAREALTQYADQWEQRSIRAWEEGWWGMPVSVGNLIGRIIGAREGEVVMMQNVSMANWIVTSCLDWNGRRNKIVFEELNFPSNLYHYHALAGAGARVVAVPSEDGLTVPLDRFLQTIDEETALVSVSHVLFRSSFIQDVKAIAARAHQVGALICADIYQSAGTVPVNVTDMGVDFATGGSVKWLCGGPGAGYLYVQSDIRNSLRPKATGWMAHRNPFGFDSGPIDYAEDGFRFLHGTPNVPGMFAARAGYEIILAAGVDRIREKSLRQTRRLLERAAEAGYPVRTPLRDAVRGGTVTLDVPNGQEVTTELLRRDVLVDFRPGSGIRIAPHFYSTDEEVDAMIDAISSVLATQGVASGRRG